MTPVARPVALQAATGERLALDPARWHAGPSPFEQRLLRGLPAPVIDVGCGPGRLVAALGRIGTAALGVDPAPAAVDLARRRGAAVLQRSVFDPLPGEGRWMTVLLLDGNVGIVGDPVRLLRRCRELAAPRGVTVVEVDRPGTGRHRHRVRLERAGRRSAWFDWAVVGADAIAAVAAVAGWRVEGVAHDQRDDRWFARLTTPDRRQ